MNPHMTNASHDLVASFQGAHQAILSSMDQVVMVVRSYPQARSRLPEFNERVLAHFGRQDKDFYDRLLERYAAERGSLKMIEFLIHDLKDAKIQCLTFLEKYAGYPGGQAATRNFLRDFLAFKTVIINRIQMEEEYLFPLLARMSSRDNAEGLKRE